MPRMQLAVLVMCNTCSTIPSVQLELLTLHVLQFVVSNAHIV